MGLRQCLLLLKKRNFLAHGTGFRGTIYAAPAPSVAKEFPERRSYDQKHSRGHCWHDFGFFGGLKY
jgi:hypothetical protein